MSLECLSFAQSIWEEMPRGRVIFVVVERFRLTSSPICTKIRMSGECILDIFRSPWILWGPWARTSLRIGL